MSQLTTSPRSSFKTGGKPTPEMIAEFAEEAEARLEGYIEPTPLDFSPVLSTSSVDVFVKDETGHAGGSFKDRGSGNSVKAGAEKGLGLVVTSSAGNHGAGVGRAAAETGLDALVVVPSSAPEQKRNRIKDTGAELVVHGHNFDESLTYGLGLSSELEGHFVHPYADPLVMAGQATIGLELLRQSPDATHVVLPAGGGGMLAGVGSVIKQHRKEVNVIAAQVEGNTAYVDSLRLGRPLTNQPIDPRFEGIAVGNVHPMTFDIAKRVVDQTVVVSPTELDQAIYDHYQEKGVLLERAGAVSLAAAKKLAGSAMNGAKILSVASGANVPAGLDKEILRV